MYILMFYMQNYVLLIFPIMSVCYLLYLTNLNDRIRQKVSHILVQLQNQTTRRPRKALATRGQHWTQYTYASNYQTKQIVRSKTVLQIRLHEVELYQANFEMKIYNFAQLDRKFLFATILLIANYIIFIYQTKWNT